MSWLHTIPASEFMVFSQPNYVRLVVPTGKDPVTLSVDLAELCDAQVGALAQRLATEFVEHVQKRRAHKESEKKPPEEKR